jgi:purine-nucleoside phosphorylase
MEDITQYKPFGKVFPNDPDYVKKIMKLVAETGYEIRQEPVFCTDTVLCEYAHMDFIKSFGVTLIEMETSSFYLMADLLEKPAIALLVVSDNSATGESLVTRTKEQVEINNASRFKAIPEILIKIARTAENT